MNIDQKTTLMRVTDKLTMLGYAFGQEVADAGADTDPHIAYDLAASLQDIEAELLRVPNIGRKF